MFITFVAILLTMNWGLCEKVSPKPGLKLFREDYKSVEETCLAVGFVKNNCRNDTETNNRIVVFDVRLKSHKRNLARKAKVIFETVDLNEGLGYDASSGIFTAPSGGVYVFDWTVMAWEKQYAHTSLVVNNQEKSWNYCHSVTTSSWLECTKMTIVRLKQGDKAWIGVFSEPADMHEKYTSFSGYKL